MSSGKLNIFHFYSCFPLEIDLDMKKKQLRKYVKKYEIKIFVQINFH